MRRLASRPAVVAVGSVSTLVLAATMGAGPATAAGPPSSGVTSALTAASGHGGARAGTAGQRGHWSVAKTAGGGSYTLTWRSPTPLGYTDARPEVFAHGRSAGPASVSADGRSVSVTVSSAHRPDISRFHVVMSGRTLDLRGLPKRVPNVPYVRPTHLKDLLEDPGVPGTHAITTSDYSLDPVKLPDIPQLSEMVGHVVAPTDATNSSPLVLFLHGRHEPCYKPAAGAKPLTVPLKAAQGQVPAWKCPGHQLPIPSYLGYDYVQKLLASQGYVTVSISADAINALDYHAPDGGAAARAALIKAHLDAWVDFVDSAHQPADLNNIILVGHSRGGEGVNRASLNLPTDNYEVTGQVLIGPTDFGFQAATAMPTVTILPYCDGDVSDLQGQNFTDDGRDLTAGPIAFHSSILVMGADHNFFNSEWTPGISAAPSNDDWFGPKNATCGTDNPARLSPAGQRKVGKAYIAGAVHLFADDDQDVLPMFDGSSVAVASADNADVRSHAIGGGFSLMRPDEELKVGDVDGAALRLCTGVADSNHAAACEQQSNSVRAPHWVSQYYPGVPRRQDLEMSWSAADQTAGIDVVGDPWNLSGDSALDLRTIVDPTLGKVRLNVELFDSVGGSATVTPDNNGVLQRLPGGGYSLAKRWAQTLRVPLDGVAGVDLTDIVSIDLVGKSADGRVWILDMSGEPTGGIDEPVTTALPTVSFGKVTQDEGDGPGDTTIQIPYHVTGDLQANAMLNVVVSDPFKRRQSKPQLLTILAHTTDGTVDLTYTPDTAYGPKKRRLAIVAYATLGIQTDRYLGTATIIDDDPAPHATLKADAKQVTEGESASWTLHLSEPLGFTTWMFGRVVHSKSGGKQLTVGDLTPQYRKRHLFPIPALDTPLWKTDLRIYQTVREGRTDITLGLPTRAIKGDQGTRSVSMLFRVHGLQLTTRSTVKVVDK